MTTLTRNAVRAAPGTSALADRALAAAATAWVAVAVAGQGIFALYVTLFYGGAALAGDLGRWRRVLSHGWISGDLLGNGVLALHLLFTVVVVVGGAVQLLPAVRRRAPRLHRWNGRVYLLAAAVLALGGVAMIWTRGTVGGPAQHFATSLNGVLIVVFGALAWRAALQRRFDAHRRWALRLYLVVAGVWFFRIGLMAWVVANQGPVGFDPKTFQGPFLVALSFGQYLVPLLVLEGWFHVRERAGAAIRLAYAAALGLLTLLTAGGIVAATLILWLPRMHGG